HPVTEGPGAVVVFLDEATAGAEGATASDDFASDGSITGLTLTPGTVALRPPGTLWSAVTTEVVGLAGDSTVDPRIPYTVGSLTLAPGLALSVEATGASFAIDEAMAAPLDVSVTSAGPLTIAAGGSVTSVLGDVVIVAPEFHNFGGGAAI